MSIVFVVNVLWIYQALLATCTNDNTADAFELNMDVKM
jgi:hypothetical protein